MNLRSAVEASTWLKCVGANAAIELSYGLLQKSLALKVDWLLLVNSLSSSQEGGNEVAVAFAVGA